MALEGLGLAFGVTESLIVEVESEVIDSMESQGPEGSATSRMLWGVVALRYHAAWHQRQAQLSWHYLEQHHVHPRCIGITCALAQSGRSEQNTRCRRGNMRMSISSGSWSRIGMGNYRRAP